MKFILPMVSWFDVWIETRNFSIETSSWKSFGERKKLCVGDKIALTDRRRPFNLPEIIWIMSWAFKEIIRIESINVDFLLRLTIVSIQFNGICIVVLSQYPEKQTFLFTLRFFVLKNCTYREFKCKIRWKGLARIPASARRQ